MRFALIGALLLVAAAFATQAPSAPRWEYAELSVASGGTSWIATWMAGDSIVALQNTQDALRAFGANTTARAPLSAILNRLGGQGWEIASVEGHSYFFKRPAR